MHKSIDLVPDSIRGDPQVQAACEAIDRELIEIYKEIPSISFWPNLWEQVPPLLDVMMWEYHVDVHQMIMDGTDLTDQKKRQLIDDSIKWHQRKGTKWIIETALSTLFENVTVVEWFQYGGKPYFFKILVSSALDDPAVYRRVLEIVYELKNARSWLEEFVIAKVSELDLWHAQAVIKRVTTQVFPALTPIEPQVTVYVGISMCIYNIITIDVPMSDMD